MDKVESIQRRATKLITNLRNKNYEERLIALDLPSMIYRRKRGDMITMYKIINEHVRVNFNEIFTSASTSHNLRGHHYKIHKVLATKRPRIDTFSHRIVNDWNNLPEHVVNAPSINIFKNELDTFWKHRRYILRDE